MNKTFCPRKICPEKSYSTKNRRGFTMVEVLVGAAVFLIVALAAYNIYTALFQVASNNQARTLAIALANEQFEIIRNMPYVSVGLTNGIPLGTLPQTQTIVRGGVTFTVGLTIRNMDFSTTTVQASSKLVEVAVACATCKNFTTVTLTGQVAPANLQSASNGGALVVQVINSAGNPVSNASIALKNTASSSIQDNDVTNNSGILNIVGVPQGLNAYNIMASKTGYSTASTSAISASNPSPTLPDVTVLNQQVSQVTLAIDLLSTLNVSGVSATCQPVTGFHFTLTGAKKIGVNLPKYSQSLVTAGVTSLNNMEWDTYTVTPTDTAYYVVGINPLSPLILNPGSTQNLQIVVTPKSGNGLKVTAIDSATKLPITNATVRVTGNGFDLTQITGQGSINQADWSSGSGQDTFSNPSKYFSDNGNVDTTSVAGNITLRKSGGLYSSSGNLESSTFDVGLASNFYVLSWKPSSQPLAAGANSVKFQLASNSEITATTTWNYVGPDGTTGSYYTVTDSPISAVHAGKQYLRYKAYLSTAVATSTPTISNISFTYASQCTPPGQVLFSGLGTGTYSVTVSKTGYTTSTNNVTVSSGWQNKNVELGP